MQGPFDFALLGANRQVLRVRIPQLRSADLKVQFAARLPGAPPAAEGAALPVVPAAESVALPAVVPADPDQTQVAAPAKAAPLAPQPALAPAGR
jgi:hypothetical protein